MNSKSIQSEELNAIYRECLFLVKTDDMMLAYCLRLKLWNELCPARCPYFEAGSPGSIEALEEGKYIMDCQKFGRKLSATGAPVPYCALYMVTEPPCRRCFYPH